MDTVVEVGWYSVFAGLGLIGLLLVGSLLANLVAGIIDLIKSLSSRKEESPGDQLLALIIAGAGDRELIVALACQVYQSKPLPSFGQEFVSVVISGDSALSRHFRAEDRFVNQCLEVWTNNGGGK
ncbi:hypothetical protein A2382_01790 [Candidatus Woesebacteria bacterium RIFOXYB1_FULL_38_16]|uniref:Uncharacterized protein n=1 Tax=Candidatus Woesebacteria bacterium RIFOXYB1_FULL_38_16 TaxID=1802538 RepID=A0A1F8CTG0_9BACT|nr:MAG: hypothetical protein A2191_02735 [Candidatus Woesebacteria bacterium RIFOXYA1_FULL_38_9]OGM79633.1 MAG: hypothetical protein A2382_01790 [Candidatus Woesebacteria bacterium RIFOXYB1_FULL_38_16]